MTELTHAEWTGMLRDYQRSAWRWEQQPFYASDVSSGWPDRWKRGDQTPPDYIASWSANVVAVHLAAGRAMTRVRVIDDPETEIQQWAEWAAQFNRVAGETIHRITRAEAEALGIVGDPFVDFWLLDDSAVLLQRFDQDRNLYRVDLDETAETLASCRQTRDRAMGAVAALS